MLENYKSTKYPNTFILVAESKLINIDWLYIVAECNMETINKFFSTSIEFSYRKLILNFIKQEKGTTHFQNKTIITMYGIELFHIESLPHPNSVSFAKPNLIRIRVANPIFYSKYTIFLIKTLFSNHLLNISNFYISELHLALDGADKIYQILNRMLKYNDYDLAYLPKNEMGYGRKFNSHIYSPEKGNFLGHTIGSKNNNLWISCYNKLSDLEQKEKTYIKQYWINNNIDFTQYDNQFYRFEIRMSRGCLKEYISDNDLSILERNNFCSLYKTIFNDRLKFKKYGKVENDIKLHINETKHIVRTKFDTIQSERMYKQYFGYWVSQYYNFSIKNIDGTGDNVSLEFIENQINLMISYVLNFNIYNLNYLHEKLKKITKRFPTRTIKKQAIKIQNNMFEIYSNLDITAQYNIIENLDVI